MRVSSGAQDIDCRGVEVEIDLEGSDDLRTVVSDTTVRGEVLHTSGDHAADARVTLVSLLDSRASGQDELDSWEVQDGESRQRNVKAARYTEARAGQ